MHAVEKKMSDLFTVRKKKEHHLKISPHSASSLSNNEEKSVTIHYGTLRDVRTGGK